jgi:hypothetical protein
MLGELALNLYAVLPAWDDLIYPRLLASLFLVFTLYYCWYQLLFSHISMVAESRIGYLVSISVNNGLVQS